MLRNCEVRKVMDGNKDSTCVAHIFFGQSFYEFIQNLRSQTIIRTAQEDELYWLYA